MGTATGSRGAGKGTHSRISGRMTSNPPRSARMAMLTSPFVIPPSTLRCSRSAFESSFMLSITARVWNAFASSVARAMCAGVVYDVMPAVHVRIKVRDDVKGLTYR